jgi:hypothetical protein
MMNDDDDPSAPAPADDSVVDNDIIIGKNY